MRTHAKIIKDAGGADAIRRRLNVEKLSTIRSWVQRDSIPSDHWRALADQNVATLDELATHAAARA